MAEFFSDKVLSAASWQAMSWEDYCKNMKFVGGVSSGGPSDVNCKNTMLGENYYGSNIYATLQLLSTYGLQGDISVKKNVMIASQLGGGSKPVMQWISLVKGCKHEDKGCLPGIPYCSVLPSDYSQLVEKLTNSSILCTPRARRGMGRNDKHPLSAVYSVIHQSLNGLNLIPFRAEAGSAKKWPGPLASYEERALRLSRSLRKVWSDPTEATTV